MAILFARNINVAVVGVLQPVTDILRSKAILPARIRRDIICAVRTAQDIFRNIDDLGRIGAAPAFSIPSVEFTLPNGRDMRRRWPLRTNVLPQLDSEVILIAQAAAIGIAVAANIHLGVFLIQIEIDGVFGQIIVAVYNSRTIGCNRCCIARRVCVILHSSVRRRRDGRTHNTRSLFRGEIGIRGVIVLVKCFFQIDNVVFRIACGPLGVNYRIGSKRQLLRCRRGASFV